MPQEKAMVVGVAVGVAGTLVVVWIVALVLTMAEVHNATPAARPRHTTSSSRLCTTTTAAGARARPSQ